MDRARLLAAQVDIALAAHDIDLADAATDEIAEIAAEFDSDGLRAVAHRCRGAVSLAHGKPVLALGSLRLAIATWQELDVPYELARTRALLADAYRLLEDDDAAARECAAARTVFARLGAEPDLSALDAGDVPPGGLTRREVEVRCGSMHRRSPHVSRSGPSTSPAHRSVPGRGDAYRAANVASRSHQGGSS